MGCPRRQAQQTLVSRITVTRESDVNTVNRTDGDKRCDHQDYSGGYARSRLPGHDADESRHHVHDDRIAYFVEQG